MRYQHGNTLCLSTQVGCRMGCTFCASTLEGRVRNLTAGELLGQVTAIERDEAPTASGRAVTNIVLMGSGEPLDNYDNVVAFLKRATAPTDWALARATYRFPPADWCRKSIGLCRRTACDAVHFPARALGPAARQHHACQPPLPHRAGIKGREGYAETTGRRVIIEYALIEA